MFTRPKKNEVLLSAQNKTICYHLDNACINIGKTEPELLGSLINLLVEFQHVYKTKL